jgi:hypothetical protein
MEVTMAHSSPRQLVTGWAALPVLREADMLIIAARRSSGPWAERLVRERNALLRTVDPSMWNGREILEEAR